MFEVGITFFHGFFAGIAIEIGRGTIRSAICQTKFVVDIVPVDFVVNTLICSAWQVATDKSLRVFNCTSGSLNPIR